MSIRIVCPNGHALRVDESHAGKTGLCPACKARVQVPQIRTADVSEDAILGILGPHSPRASPAATASPMTRPVDEHGVAGPPKKNCHKCYREITAGTHICPFCHTYIASLADF